MKCAAYRSLVYIYPQYRAEAEMLLNYIRRKHDLDMRKEKTMDSKLSYFSAISSLRSDRETEFLLTGKEDSDLHPLAGFASLRSDQKEAVMLGQFRCGDVFLGIEPSVQV